MFLAISTPTAGNGASRKSKNRLCYLFNSMEHNEFVALVGNGSKHLSHTKLAVSRYGMNGLVYIYISEWTCNSIVHSNRLLLQRNSTKQMEFLQRMGTIVDHGTHVSLVSLWCLCDTLRLIVDKWKALLGNPRSSRWTLDSNVRNNYL